MCYLKFIVTLLIVLTKLTHIVGEGASKFRILAPQFICPKDGDAVLDKPDNTVITLQTADDADLRIEWTVRWVPLVRPSQRFTLMLWRTVRELEKHLNKPQPEPYVFIIDNADLLRGVNYVFTVTAVDANGNIDVPKSFNIDNVMGDNKLMIEGRNDMLSVLLVGGQVAHADSTFAVEAQVTTCYYTQDYYFVWAVQSITSNDTVDVSEIQGSRLELLPYSIRAGLTYNINGKIMRLSNGDLITQTSLLFKVSHRGLEVYLNIDTLIVSANYSFSIESVVISHDYYNTSITYKWHCAHESYECDADDLDYEFLNFPFGIQHIGRYTITLTVSVLDQTEVANATVVVVAPILPVIEITPIPRLLNEGSLLSLVANASNVAPSCTLSWYFATEQYLESLNDITNETCDDCQLPSPNYHTNQSIVHGENFIYEYLKHGELLSDSITIFSLEEQFLSELADFTNETEWRQVTASLPAAAGRARFLAQCGCSLTFSCDTLGTLYADLWFQLNESPKGGKVMISPESGSALETVYRISTLPASDPDGPLTYSFYCRVGIDEDLLLGSFIEHRAVETFLPYMEDGTEVWVEVCDALGACSAGDILVVTQTPGEGRTLDTLTEDARAHARRCELAQLRKVAVSAVVTYNNTGQHELLSKFTSGLDESLASIDQECITRHHQLHSNILSQLARLGVDTISQ